MSQAISDKDVFRELEVQNPAVAQAFRSFRRHGEEPELARQMRVEVEHRDEWPVIASGETYHYSRAVPHAISERRQSSSFIVPLLLVIGVIAAGIVVGPGLVRFLVIHWEAVLLPIGGICVGAATVLSVSRVTAFPLRTVAPPNVAAEDPLQELKDLAERTASRLRAAYRFQLWTVFAVGAIFITLIVWSMVLVSQNRIVYASAFGSSSVAMMILTQWKWQPFDRINQARRLADNADTLATGLRLRMKTISEIVDPFRRAKAQGNVIDEFLKRS